MRMIFSMDRMDWLKSDKIILISALIIQSFVISMGNCDVCSKEMEYNAIDSEDLMQKLENT